MELTYKKLEEMALSDIKKADITELTDLMDIKIDANAPVEKKLASFAKQTSNVYLNRTGDYIVKVIYQETGPGLNDKMEEYIKRMSGTYI